jgi:hypothetical protein
MIPDFADLFVFFFFTGKRNQEQAGNYKKQGDFFSNVVFYGFQKLIVEILRINCKNLRIQHFWFNTEVKTYESGNNTGNEKNNAHEPEFRGH